jgi:hypothetical protein
LAKGYFKAIIFYKKGSNGDRGSPFEPFLQNTIWINCFKQNEVKINKFYLLFSNFNFSNKLKFKINHVWDTKFYFTLFLTKTESFIP